MDENQQAPNEDQKTHYVCPSCGGVSNNPKNCETVGCDMVGQPLKECSCTDGKHGKDDDDTSDE